jgi:hypothetical protein
MAGQATTEMLKMFPFLGEVSYYPTPENTREAMEKGLVDTCILTEQTTEFGFSQADQEMARPDSKVYLTAEAWVPYNCIFMVKKGSKLSDIKRVTGHGSLRHCKAWLDKNLPGVPYAAHEQNSMAAAREVAESDGSIAVVSTLVTKDQVPGLEPLAENIDGGVLGNWWATSSKPFFSGFPNRIVVATRAGADGKLGELIAALRDVNFDVYTSYSTHAGAREKVEYDYLMWFRGQAELDDVQSVLGNFDQTRLAGAYEMPRAQQEHGRV